jgi:dynein intermediate chain 1
MNITGVMALHFHPSFANLLAVGCYDGSVMVFDVQSQTDAPLYRANIRTKQHTDPVWQVCWQVRAIQAGR